MTRKRPNTVRAALMCAGVTAPAGGGRGGAEPPGAARRPGGGARDLRDEG
ncbi:MULTISPECIES: hypothetical protein [Streptomyces]